MEKMETLEEFYRRKAIWVPDNLRNEIGHFNVFRHEPIEAGKARPVPYKRRDFFKIMLVVGDMMMHYADRTIQVKKQAIFFSNPLIPYSCEGLERIESGAFCIFNQQFFQPFNPNQYSVFQPNCEHVFELSDAQSAQVAAIFERIFDEIGSDYVHKYDVLRNLVFELLHFAMKTQPSSAFGNRQINAAQRITTLFLELLERQFPIDENHSKIALRTPSDFAAQLNVHINHLNRAIRDVTEKTTSQLLAERVVQEAKILLKHSVWSVSEVAFALGFSELSHFNNFFKKHVGTSPVKFRN